MRARLVSTSALPDKDVWQLLLTEEYITEAELLISAAIGADVAPEVLTAELERSALTLAQDEDDAAAIADRMVRLVAAVTALSRASLEAFAVMAEWAKLPKDEEPDPEEVRNSMLHLLNEYASALRDQIR